MSDLLTCPTCGHGFELAPNPFDGPAEPLGPCCEAERTRMLAQDMAAGAVMAEAEKAAREQRDAEISDAAPEQLTDAVVAQRVHDELLAERFCWAVGFGWMRWNGSVWAETAEETVVEEIRLWAVESIKPQLANPYIGTNKELRQRLLGLLDRYRLIGLSVLARGLCQVDARVFDAEPDLLNTPAGVVDLRTGELLPHEPSRYMTRIAGVAYVPGATHPDWTAALGAVPADVAGWLQVRFGQAITGHMTPDDVLLLLHGGGSNGKSTVLDGVKKALGGPPSGYSTYVSDRVLLAKADAHPTELTEFRGARFALTEELPDGGHLNAKRLKDIIGTPTMTARKIRQDSITWDSTHSMFLSTNYLPKVTETDNGTWRRLALVDFPYTFVAPDKATGAPNERLGDPGLRDRLAGDAQRAAVLAWLVEGARLWYAAGRAMPPAPAAVADATRAWREASDIVLRFWAECLRPSPRHYIASPDMLAEFNLWAETQGHKARSIQQFNGQFGEHEATKAAGVVYGYRYPKADHLRAFRPQRPGGFLGATASAVPPPDKKIRAWWGVRFASEQEE